MHLFRRDFAPSDEALLQDFSDYYTAELGRSPNTARGYVQQLASVAEMLDKGVADVSVTDLRHAVKRDQSVALGTKQLRITAYRKFHEWGLLEGYGWADVRILGVKAPPSPRRMPKPPISLLDAHKLLAACHTPNQFRVIYFGLYAATRVMESAQMNPGHFHRDRLTFIGKGNKERTVPVHPRLLEVLPVIFETQPASPGVLEDVFAKLRNAHGIRDLKGKPATTHSLRRTCADFIYSTAGFPREVVVTILGHKSEVTDLYCPVRFPKMQEALFSVDYTRGEPIQMSLF